MHRAFEVTILGTSSASPTKHRHPSAQFVRMEGEYMLLDCGEGTQLQLVKYGLRTHRIRYVFITHLHGDHFFGLPGLITSMGLHGRTEKLTIAGPEGLEQILSAILESGETKLPFELEYLVCNPNVSENIVETHNFSVQTVPLKHRIPCTGFILREKGPELKLNIARCEELHIPPSFFEGIKLGSDYTTLEGKVIRNAELTLAGSKNRSYAYISDTIFDEQVADAVKGVELLYHEATFLHELLERANETYHTTALQAGQIAKMAGVNKLVIGHFSARYQSLEALGEEACGAFPNTEIAEEGKCYLV
jgi:ribonuclease Z